MEATTQSHSIRLDGRRKLTVSGVQEVLRFEDTQALLSTSMGQLLIEGQELLLKSLTTDSAVVTVEGSVEALSYRTEPGGGWLQRLLG